MNKKIQKLTYILTILGGIFMILPYLSEEKGLFMQIVAATGLALIFGAIVYEWGDRQREEKGGGIHVPPSIARKILLPKRARIAFVVIGILWFLFVGYLMLKESAFQPTISSVPGMIDNAVKIPFCLEEDKWVGIHKTLDAGLLVGTSTMKFYSKGRGEPNTIELKLIHVPDENGKECVCRKEWHSKTNTGDAWTSLEAPYTDFECWPGTCPPGESSPQLDVGRVHRVDFAISNKPNKGDIPGPGVVLLDHVQAITTNQGASVTPVIVDMMNSTSGWETYYTQNEETFFTLVKRMLQRMMLCSR